MPCDRLFTFDLGRLPLPFELMVEGGGTDNVVTLPMGSLLVRSPDGWFLFDLGLSEDYRDPAVGAEMFLWGRPEFPGAGDPVLETLERCGVRREELAAIVLSHLHIDHTGGLRHFGAGPPIVVQRAELEQAHAETAVARLYRPEDYADELRLRWQPIEGETAIADGITAIPSPGHTPGHMSFRIDMGESGAWLFAFDAVPTGRNVELDRPVNNGIGSVEERRASHDLLVARARRDDARLVPGHCPETWPALRSPPASYA